MKMKFMPKRKLRAATAARRMPRGAMEGYAAAQEPDISFAKAAVVVLVLHVVAVGGIWAFSTLKTHSASSDSATLHRTTAANAASTTDATADDEDTAKPTVAPQPEATTKLQPRTPVADPGVANNATPKTVEQPVKQPVKETTVPAPVKDSGTTYTVAKGDSPVTIAKKFHVSYDELLKANKITDPKKLQIGQKLHIPAKKTTP